MHSVSTDRSRKLVHLTLSGFIDVAEAQAIVRETQAAPPFVGCPEGGHLFLADVSHCPLQSQEVMAVFLDGMTNARLRSRRAALYAGKAAMRMQARRLMVRDNIRMFDDLGEAEAWLTEALAMPWTPPARSAA